MPSPASRKLPRVDTARIRDVYTAHPRTACATWRHYGDATAEQPQTTWDVSVATDPDGLCQLRIRRTYRLDGDTSIDLRTPIDLEELVALGHTLLTLAHDLGRYKPADEWRRRAL